MYPLRSGGNTSHHLSNISQALGHVSCYALRLLVCAMIPRAGPGVSGGTLVYMYTGGHVVQVRNQWQGHYSSAMRRHQINGV